MKMLRTIRKKSGLTMKELGEMVGVSESAISQYETGKREADFETLLKIGEILNCSVDYLLRGEESKVDLQRDSNGSWTNTFRESLSSILSVSDNSDIVEIGIDVREADLIAEGAAPVSLEKACEIADTMGTSLDEMVGLKKTTPTPVAEDGRKQEFIELFSLLSEEQKKMIVAQIRGILAAQE